MLQFGGQDASFVCLETRLAAAGRKPVTRSRGAR